MEMMLKHHDGNKAKDEKEEDVDFDAYECVGTIQAAQKRAEANLAAIAKAQQNTAEEIPDDTETVPQIPLVRSSPCENPNQ